VIIVIMTNEYPMYMRKLLYATRSCSESFGSHPSKWRCSLRENRVYYYVGTLSDCHNCGRVSYPSVSYFISGRRKNWLGDRQQLLNFRHILWAATIVISCEITKKVASAAARWLVLYYDGKSLGKRWLSTAARLSFLGWIIEGFL